MNEPKPIASLSSGLLARKGAARPAMRPQGFQQVGGNLEDLGWNDMGFEPPKPAVVPVRDEDHDAFGEDLEERDLGDAVLLLYGLEGGGLQDAQADPHRDHDQGGAQ